MTIFYPIISATQEVVKGLASCLEQDDKDIEILILLQVAQDDLPQESINFLEGNKSIRIIEAKCRNIAELMNKGLSVAEADIFVHLQPNIILAPNFVSKVKAEFIKKANIGYVYSNFRELYPDGEEMIKKLRDASGDITERANYGFIKSYSKKAVVDVGMYDETFNRAEEYDLKLRLEEKYALVFIPEELYTVHISPEKAEEKVANVGASKLFFPGEGKYGGFSYLFYDKEEEKEIEEAFMRFQKRQEFYLEHENAEVTYNPDEHFSPLVSVVIPVFNRVDYIGKAIDSVLANDFQDFEIIVVDNGSTDGTIEVAEKYFNNKPEKVKLIKNDKNIIAYSLNLGVGAARGKYISQLDSDDEYTPETLKHMVEYLENHTKCALAISYYNLIDESGKTLDEFGIIKHLEYSRNNIMRVDGAGALRMWHKKVIKEFGGFNEADFGHYGEDYDMVLRVSEKYDVCRVHKILYHYRRHPDNTDIKRDPEMKILNKIKARAFAIERRKNINRKRAAGQPLWN